MAAMIIRFTCCDNPVGAGHLSDCHMRFSAGCDSANPEPVGDSYKSMEEEITRLKNEQLRLNKLSDQACSVLNDEIARLSNLLRLAQSSRNHALCIFLDEAPQYMYRYGTRLSIRVDLCPEMFEYSWLSRPNGQDGMVDISGLAMATGRETGEKIATALIEWCDKRNNPGSKT